MGEIHDKNLSKTGFFGLFIENLEPCATIGSNMKTLTLLGFIFIALGLLASPLAVFGQDLPVNALDTSNTGILPTNTFYFLKEFGRGIQKLFRTSPISKAEVELRILNEKASELKKLYEINPNNLTGISRAIASYEGTAQALRDRIATLRGLDQAANFDRVINETLNRVITHQQFFDDLRGRVEFNTDFLAVLDSTQSILTDTLTAVVEKVDGSEKFSERFLTLISKHTGELKELRAAEVLDRLEERLAPEFLPEIIALKEELLIKFSGRLDSEALSPTLESLLPQLEVVPGDQLRRVKVLDEVREIVTNSDLKSQINVIRQRVLDKAQETGVVNSEKVEEAIAASQAALVDFETFTSGQLLSASVKQLIERAKFNLKQAQDLFAAGNYGGAYGQSTAALAAIKNAVNQINAVGSFDSEISSLRKTYDNFLAKAKNIGYDAKNQPKLFSLFNETEQKIGDLAKSVKAGVRTDRLIQQLRSIKLLLGTIE